MSDADILKEAREVFERCLDNESENRRLAKEDIEFARLSKQWHDADRKAREADHRPCLTINKLGPVIRQVVNDARQNRPSIRVLPADSKADIKTAEVLSGLIRNIEQSSDADVAYDTGVDAAVSGGFGYWRVNLDYSYGGSVSDDLSTAGVELFEQDIRIERIANQFAVYGDPDSTQADSSDWMRAFVVEEVTQEEFKRKYPKAKVSDFDQADWANVAGRWKTDSKVLVGEYWKREESVRLVIGVELAGDLEAPGETVVMTVEEWEKQRAEIEAKGGKAVTMPRPIKSYAVTQYLMTGVEILETNKWPGCFIPIIPVYGDEVNLEGKRHFRSLVRDAKDPNRMFNYWRSMATELVALAPKTPFIGKKGAFESDAAKWATANTRSWSHIEYDGPERPTREPFAGVPQGALQEALNASDDIKAITGIYDASLGARSNETSGKAIMARQREGDVSTFHFIDNQVRAIRHTGRIIIDLIPKVYSTPRIVRILGPDGKPENIPINGMPAGESEGGDNTEATARIHDLRVGRYDLAVSAGPSFTTKREEAATQMIELIRSYPDAAPVIGDLLAKNLDWPGADEIAKRLERMLPPEMRDDESGDIPPEVQQQLQQMGEAIQVLGEQLREAQDKANIEREKVGVDRYRAETERFQLTAPAMGPQEIQTLVIQTIQQLLTPDTLPHAEGANGPTGMEPEPEFMPA